MNRGLRARVRRRARGRCEYCRTPARYESLPVQIDHVIAAQHGGGATYENLALSCLHCNSHKRPNVAGVDPVDGGIVPLFNPRVDKWADHFRFVGARLVAKTAAGRATIRTLAMNDGERIRLRATLIATGEF